MTASRGLGLIGLMLAMARSASAATATANPTADTFVSSVQPNGNYGAAGALEISAVGLPKGEFQSLMKFDLSTAKSNFDATFGAGLWTVQSAALQFTTASPNNAIFNTNAAGLFALSWIQNDSWSEGTGTPMLPTTDGVTYNTLPSFLSGSDQSLGTYAFAGATGTNTYTLDLASGLVSDITGGATASMRMLAADSGVSDLLNSRSFVTASLRPLLTINAVPEPSAGLTALGYAAIAMMCRRKRR